MIFFGKIDIFSVTKGITINQCDKYTKYKIILIKLFGNTGPSCFLWHPNQEAIAERVNAVSEIGQ